MREGGREGGVWLGVSLFRGREGSCDLKPSVCSSTLFLCTGQK